MALFGKAEKMPETLAELTALCPELIAQAKQEAIASIDIEAAKKEAAAGAAKSSQEQYAAGITRLKGIMTATLGEEIASKVNAIFASGITGEQYLAIGKPLIDPLHDSKAEMAKKEEILAELKRNGAENPGHDSGKIDLSTLPVEDRCKIEWDKSPDLRAEFGELKNYIAYEKALASGRAKILNFEKGGK